MPVRANPFRIDASWQDVLTHLGAHVAEGRTAGMRVAAVGLAVFYVDPERERGTWRFEFSVVEGLEVLDDANLAGTLADTLLRGVERKPDANAEA